MRILVTGCHGLLGQKLVEEFDPDYCELHGVDLQPSNLFNGLNRYTYHRVDLTARNEVLDLLREVKPRVIVNTAAMTGVDACEVERERCWQVNTTAVQNLVDGARRIGAKVIQVSTDYVFDGEAGPYTELDHPNPISYYGKSKLAAENLVLGSGVDGAVARTVVLFGHGRNLRPSFVAWLVAKLRDNSEVKIVTDQISNITLVDDLARAIKRMVTLNKTGIYHVAGREILSRYDFALKIADAYGLDSSLIMPTLTRLLGQAAPRPLQGGLVVDKAQRELNLTFADVAEALQRYREQEAQLN